MSKTAVLGLAACGAILALGSALASDESPSIDDDSREAIQAIGRQVEAWNRGDLEGFTAMYDEDCVFVTPDGVTRGRDAVLDRYRRRYPDRAAMGSLAIEIERATSVRGTGDAVVAVAIAGRWSLHYPDDGARDTAEGWTAIVLERGEDGGWKIIQDASM